jgi:hypothetical protein
MGNPTCILYYSTNPSNMPGYIVSPNVAYQITASEGELIYFYYTYSYPGQGEHNNSADKDTYVVGSCKTVSIPDFDESTAVKYFPNPVSNKLSLELPVGRNEITVFDCTGRTISSFVVTNKYSSFDMENFDSGVYIFRVSNNMDITTFKVIK